MKYPLKIVVYTQLKYSLIITLHSQTYTYLIKIYYLCVSINNKKTMCGIVGYIGQREAFPILIKGLHRLEYRGYDSAGIALLDNSNDLRVYKTKGKVSDLEQFAKDKNCNGTIGIAHTRWATHGEPNKVNAHPHSSQSEELALFPNGIIENYAVLKQQLMKEAYAFQTCTDRKCTRLNSIHIQHSSMPSPP